MGKTLNRIIQGIVLGASLLSIGCNGKDISNQNVNNSNNQTTVVSTQQNNNSYNQEVNNSNNQTAVVSTQESNNSSGIEKIINKIAPKQEVLLHETLTQEEKEFLETKYGKDGGLWGLYYKLTDKDFALYGKDPETGIGYYYDIGQYNPNNKTDKKFFVYAALKNRNGDNVLVRLHDKLIEGKSAVTDRYETHDYFSIGGYNDENIISGIYYLKNDEQSALNGDYAFIIIYHDDQTQINRLINPAELVRFSETQDFATIDYNTGKIISSDSRILGDVDPKLLEIFRTCYE